MAWVSPCLRGSSDWGCSVDEDTGAEHPKYYQVSFLRWLIPVNWSVTAS